MGCKYMKRYILLSVLPILITLSPSLFAQSAERAAYAEAAAEKALIYRGRLAPEYNFRCNGHCYVESKEFKRGSVMYNGRLYEDVLLNIDACSNLLLVKQVMCSATVRDYVDYAVIDGRRYVNLNYQGRCENAPEGFLEEICKGGGLGFYSKVTKRISSDDGYHNGEDIGYYDPDYLEYVTTPAGDMKVQRYFQYFKKYYVVKDGNAYMVRNRRAFLKLFDRHTASRLRHYANERDLYGQYSTLEDYVKALISHIEEEKL